MKRRLMMPFNLPYAMMGATTDWFAIHMLFKLDAHKGFRWSRAKIDASPIVRILTWLNNEEIMYHVEIEDVEAECSDDRRFRYVLVMEEMDAAILRFHQPELIIGSLCNE